MKTKIILIGLAAIFFYSCKSVDYLPSPNAIDVNQYGSYIRVDRNTASNINGELIAIDSSQIIVLLKTENKCTTVPLYDVSRFRLRYAKQKHYGWTIPTTILLPFIHGFFSILSLPINLIVTISVTAAGERSFQYSNENISFETLKMFARFPQGIPPGVDLAEIRR